MFVYFSHDVSWRGILPSYLVARGRELCPPGRGDPCRMPTKSRRYVEFWGLSLATKSFLGSPPRCSMRGARQRPYCLQLEFIISSSFQPCAYAVPITCARYGHPVCLTCEWFKALSERQQPGLCGTIPSRQTRFHRPSSAATHAHIKQDSAKE